jgi:hypothetical protein
VPFSLPFFFGNLFDFQALARLVAGYSRASGAVKEFFYPVPEARVKSALEARFMPWKQKKLSLYLVVS